MSKEEVVKALNELKAQLGEKVVNVEADRVELLEDAKVQH
jgi:hypothetical protein